MPGVRSGWSDMHSSEAGATSITHITQPDYGALKIPPSSSSSASSAPRPASSSSKRFNAFSFFCIRVHHEHARSRPLTADARLAEVKSEQDRQHREPGDGGLKQAEKNEKMKQPVQMVTELEYEALPESIRRKYFSSVERLRIAEHAGASTLQPPIQSRGLRTAASHHSTLRTSSSGSSKPSGREIVNDAVLLKRSRTGRKLRKQSIARNDTKITQPEAEWFLSLPDKIRRRYFNRQEQVLLASQCEELCLKIDRDNYHKARSIIEDRPHSNRVEGAQRTSIESIPRRHSTASLSDHGFDFELEDPREEQPLPNHPESNVTQIVDTRQPAPDMDTKPQAGRRSRRSSFRRTLSLTSNPFARTSISSAPPLPPSPLPVKRPRAGSNVLPLHTPAPPLMGPLIDPEAAHYQDPEARMKLRLYLASPAKFDEALEFGFPATKPPSVANTAPSTPLHPPLAFQDRASFSFDRRKTNQDVQTFLNGDSMSFLDHAFEDTDRVSLFLTHENDDAISQPHNNTSSDDDDDDISLASTSGPITPSEAHRDRPTYSNFSSIDSVGLPALQHARTTGTKLPLNSHDLFEAALTGQREMTLRMTLTRKDLRADEDSIYGWQNQVHQVQGGFRPGHKARSQTISHPTGYTPWVNPTTTTKEEDMGRLSKGWTRRDEPLELPDIPIIDDLTGLQGAFAVKTETSKSKGMSRFFRKVTGKR